MADIGDVYKVTGKPARGAKNLMVCVVTILDDGNYVIRMDWLDMDSGEAKSLDQAVPSNFFCMHKNDLHKVEHAV
jgi:hypothetical protein